MKTTNNTVFITGGGSGIGLAIAKMFADNDNKVIIAGRNEERLKKAAAGLKNTSYIVCDIEDAQEVDRVVSQLEQDFGKINILVNNAGVCLPADLSAGSAAYTNAVKEFEVNFFSVVRLTEKLLPILSLNEEAAVINVSSGVALTPVYRAATYSASKAAAHSYTQSLRLELELNRPQVKVFEVMPGYVETEMTAQLDVKKITPEQVAAELLTGLEKNQYEIHNGDTVAVYPDYLISPDYAIRKFNGFPVTES